MAILTEWEKDYFCTGNPMFFTDDKQKIITH